MKIVRFDEAPSYEAPGHAGMEMVRLQGREAGPSDTLWLGISALAPGGGTTLDASPIEKMYVVLDGAVTISNGEEEAVLQPRETPAASPRTRGGPSRTTPMGPPRSCSPCR